MCPKTIWLFEDCGHSSELPCNSCAGKQHNLTLRSRSEPQGMDESKRSDPCPNQKSDIQFIPGTCPSCKGEGKKGEGLKSSCIKPPAPITDHMTGRCGPSSFEAWTLGPSMVGISF